MATQTKKAERETMNRAMKKHTFGRARRAWRAWVGLLMVGVSSAMACTMTTYGVCGACTGCSYTVLCDLVSIPQVIDICTGDSIGALDRDCESGWKFGGITCVGTLVPCGAPVVLTGNCCNGSRTTTTDLTPVWDAGAVGHCRKGG